MAVIKFNGDSFDVDHAVKGSDYVHGYDAYGKLLVNIEGVKDFSIIEYDGEYLPPEECLSEVCNSVKLVADKLVRVDGTPITAQHVEAAPAGYGLGTISSGPTNQDINACVKNGWMSVYADTRNVPAGFEYSAGHVSTRAGNTYGIVQVLTGILTNKGCQMIRISTDNGLTWIEEWVNPPLLIGVEYRTTERFNGNPVYAQAINFGKGVIGGKAVDITTDIIDHLVRVEGDWVNGEIKELFTSEYIVTGVSVDRYNGASRLKVETNAGADNYTGHPVVYYTKS